jgi:cytochrome P450
MTLRSLDDLPGPPGLPGLGNVLQARTSRLHLVAEQWSREYGPMFRFDLGPRRIIGIADAATINEILRRRPAEFRRWREIETIAAETGSTGVFAAEGADWQRQRRLAVTALNSNHLHHYFDLIRRATERLHRRLAAAAASETAIAIEREFKTFTLEVTTSLAFGVDPTGPDRAGPDLRPDIDRIFDAFARRLSAPVPYWRWVRLPADRAIDRSVARLHRAVDDYIEQARARMRARPELHEHPENFLEGMLAAQAEGRYSEQEIIGNTLTMLLAGVDTTAVTLAWTSWLLARHPEVQERLASDALDLLGEETVAADYETTSRFGYGEAVVRETLRLKPAAVAILLESLGERVIAGLRIPAGTRLMLLTRDAALHEDSFDHPEAFDPARWIGDHDGLHDTKAFLAFGAGPRFCPGRNLALLEAKAALATVARNFELTLDPTVPPVTERFAFTMAPVGLRVRVRSRRARPQSRVGLAGATFNERLTRPPESERSTMRLAPKSQPAIASPAPAAKRSRING